MTPDKIFPLPMRHPLRGAMTLRCLFLCGVVLSFGASRAVCQVSGVQGEEITPPVRRGVVSIQVDPIPLLFRARSVGSGISFPPFRFILRQVTVQPASGTGAGASIARGGFLHVQYELPRRYKGLYLSIAMGGLAYFRTSDGQMRATGFTIESLFSSGCRWRPIAGMKVYWDVSIGAAVRVWAHPSGGEDPPLATFPTIRWAPSLGVGYEF